MIRGTVRTAQGHEISVHVTGVDKVLTDRNGKRIFLVSAKGIRGVLTFDASINSNGYFTCRENKVFQLEIRGITTR